MPLTIIIKAHSYLVPSHKAHLMTCMIMHQTLVGHLIPCLKTLIGACNLVTHEILVGVHAIIGDHVFAIHSPNLHDCSPNPIWTSHTLS